MTEYETASLALQAASLALQRYAVIVQVLIGAIQCGLIAGGLWLMKKAASARDAQHQEARDQHKETMVVLQQQGETLRAQRQEARDRHEETMAALQQQGEALRALIARTEPQT